MEIDETKIIAALLASAMRRGDMAPSVEQIVLTYERVLATLREREALKPES